MTTGWPGLTFSVMAFTMFAAWRTVAVAVTSSAISGRRCQETGGSSFLKTVG